MDKVSCKECRGRGDDHYYDIDGSEVTMCPSCIDNGEITPECYKCMLNGDDYYLDGDNNWVIGCPDCTKAEVSG